MEVYPSAWQMTEWNWKFPKWILDFKSLYPVALDAQKDQEPQSWKVGKMEQQATGILQDQEPLPAYNRISENCLWILEALNWFWLQGEGPRL